MARLPASALFLPVAVAALYACAADPDGVDIGEEGANVPTETRDDTGVSANDSDADRTGFPQDDDAAVDPTDSEVDDDAAEPDALATDATTEAGTYDGGPPSKDAAADATKLDAAKPDATVVKDASADVRDATVVDSGPPLDCTKVGPDGEPLELGCTTLYSSWPARTIAATARAYDPAYRMWSDGTIKSRWVQLPAGGKIDATDPNEWVFPVGTKMFKEFKLGSKRVETRMLWKKNASQWVRVTYAWSADQQTARVLRTGQKNVWGTSYEIPAQSDCETCHMGKLDSVLGYEVVGLSNAGASGFTLAALTGAGLIAPAPAPAVVPGNATEKAALGYLHANCGLACHNGSHYALAKTTGLLMRLETGELGTVASTDTWKTAVNITSKWQPTTGAGFLRIKPKDISKSAVHYRAASRTPGTQMPPMLSHQVDTAGLAIIESWIASM